MGIKMKRRTGKRGLTLVEIIVSLIIFSVGMAAIARVFLVGKHFVKEAENKSRAMQIASQQMERYLSYSYNGLETLIPVGSAQTIITGTAPSPHTNFTWQATLTKLIDSDPTGAKNIPYVNIEVICNYTEASISGVDVAKSVRILNCVPYPYFHIDEFFADYTSLASPPVATTTWADIATLQFRNQVPVDLQVIYNITLEAQDPSNNMLATDTISTRCQLNGATKYITTMTPIITQPAISNVLGIPGLAVSTGSPHTVTLQWQVDRNIPGATIKLKKVSLIVIQAEP